MRRKHGASPDGEHNPRPLGCLGNDGAFPSAKTGFALLGEYLGTAFTCLLGDEIVAIHKGALELLGDKAPDGGFAEHL